MSLPLPDPTSIVLEATHILLVRIQEARIGKWSSTPDEFLERSVQLVIELVEILKGEVEEQVNDRLRLSVTQYSSGSPRRPAAPGVWSSLALDKGTELLAFCHQADSRAAAKLLQEGACLEVLPAKDEIDDVRLALEAEARNLSPADLFALATPPAGELGYVFTRYLWAKVASHAITDLGTFELLMQFIELPELSLIARWTLLNSAYSAVLRLAHRSQRHDFRLAVSMFRLIKICSDATVTDNIIQVFLPNLLGLQVGLTRQEADEVFREFPGARSELEPALAGYQGNASTSDLLAWLKSGS